MVRRSIALLAMCLGLLLALPVIASANTGDIIEPQHEPPTNADGWQAGTCLTDEPAPEVHCGPQTGGAFFKQAAGHPPIGFTNYIIQHGPITKAPLVPPFGGIEVPVTEITAPTDDRAIKTLRVDLPPGLTVNPNAAPKCTLADFEHEEGGKVKPLCDPQSKVGEEEVTLVVTIGGLVPVPGLPGETLPKGAIVPPSKTAGTKVDVFNLVPKAGEPALFGFVVAEEHKVFLETQVAWESDFHESFTIHLEEPEPPVETLVSRLVNFGASTGNGSYITNPTTCVDPNLFPNLYSTWFRAESYGEPDASFPVGSTPVEAQVAENAAGEKKLVQQEGCANVPFDPTIKVDPGTAAIDSPAPATVTTEMPFEKPKEGGNALSQSHLNRAEITLPEGMGLNPSGSVGLVACTDAQFHKGERVANNQCPAASKIGSVEITSPPLDEALKGDIYVGEQKSPEPTSGEMFRILVEAKSDRYGIVARLIGHTQANTTTGQLTTVFTEQEVGPLAGKLPEGLPQVPFESVKLHFDGSKSVLSTPPTCAKQTTTSNMVPWSNPAERKSPTAEFTLSSEPGGGTCPTTLAARKFVPGYTAKSDSTKAGAYSPFRVNISRTDGQQEVKLVNVTLPKGLTGKLAGIPYCSEAAINGATKIGGTTEQATPSCSSKSQIGTTTTAAGTGAAPLSLPGKVYLAGPYKGAPLSLAVITPAVSGPFDLGNVVVRVAVNVNPLTAQVNPVSDPIPNVFGGVRLDIRSIQFDINRSKFMVNPTNCSKQATAGTINGGGANPADQAAWSSYAVKAPFQASKCNKLGFKPKLHVRLTGPTTRAKFPKLRAILEAKGGNANVARTALTLPHSFFVEQGHMEKVCTRPQLASHTCPSNTVYGYAEAKSPLLGKKLKGPVYLVPGGHTLPDLVADLRGQVNIQLHGVISSKRGGVKTVFNNVPDVPVTKFILNMRGGQKGLIVNSTNTCKEPQRAVLNIKGQNGKKVVNNKFSLNIKGCGKGK